MKSERKQSTSPLSKQSGKKSLKKAATTPEDIAVVCGVSSDGKGVNILRKRGETIEAGTVRKLEAGKPIHGEVVRLTPREDSPLICDVDVEFAAPASAPNLNSRPQAGPAQVASDEYRKNWDAIYKKRNKTGRKTGNGMTAASLTARPLSPKAKRLLN